MTTSESSEETSHGDDANDMQLAVRQKAPKERRMVKKRKQIRKRAPLPDELNIKPRALMFSLEAEALGFYYSTHIDVPRRPRTATGYNEEISPLHKASSPSSPLSLATTAMSCIILSAARREPAFLEQGGKTYGQCWQGLRRALLDPTESKSDETLLTSILLGIYEYGVSTHARRQRLDAHMGGVIAIFKHRGRDQLQNPTSKRLFVLIRHQMAMMCIEQSKAPTSVIGDLAFEAAEDQNIGCRLGYLSAKLADIRARLKALRSEIYSLANVATQRSEILEECHDLDIQLESLLESAPEPFPYTVCSVEDSGASQIDSSGHVYQAHIYYDLLIGRIWNAYRLVRLYLQETILDALSDSSNLNLHDSPQTLDEAVKAQQTLQQMADEISCTIPFFLGDKFPLVESSSDSDDLSPTESQRSHKRVTFSVGWLMLFPVLRKLSSLETGLLRTGQREWIEKQISRVLDQGAMSMRMPKEVLAANTESNFLWAIAINWQEERDEAIFQPPARYPCWDHDCQGREFSTSSNLSRHRREQARLERHVCPKCGASFTRSKARDDHLENNRCRYLAFEE